MPEPRPSQQPSTALIRVTVTGPHGLTDRELGLGTHVFGGSLISDAVVVGLAAPQLFSLTSRDGGQRFDLKILADDVILDGAPATRDKTTPGLHKASLTQGIFRFDIQAQDNPKHDTLGVAGLSTLGKVPFSTEGLRRSMQSTPSFEAAARKASGGLQKAWLGNPQAFAALGLAALLGLAAFVLPRSLPSFATSEGMEAMPGTVASGSALSSELKERLRAADLLHVVSVQESAEQATLSGTVNTAENLRLRDVLAGFQGRIKPPLSLRNMVAYSRPEGDTLIAGVVLKPVKAVVSDNGELVTENELLPSGWRVVRIAESGIEVTRDGLTQVVVLPGAAAAKPAAR
jgi:hypothetical protein